MQITRQPAGETLLLKLEGRLDGAWSEHTGQALTRAIEEGWHRLKLDLRGVTFLSSAGIRVLVIHYKQLLGIRGELAVIHPSPETRDVLQMAGLGMMISEAEEEEGAATDSQSSPHSPDPSEGPRQFERGGVRCEIHPLAAQAALRVRFFGADGLKNRGTENAFVRFPGNALGVGLGAFGRDRDDCRGRLGEFLALGGAAITQPADGRQTTDYVIAQGELVPEVAILSGLAAEGDFAQLLRFDAHDAPGGSIPLSALLEIVLELCGGCPAGFALAAETAFLVGAALTSQPDEERGVLFDFPEVRNRLLFTAEPAWPGSLSLAAGFVAPTAETPLASLLRPVRPVQPPSSSGASLPCPQAQAHVHAAAFPYRPLPKGVLELGPTVRNLLEGERALGLLHLLHDWRQPGGAGESRFRRGALWLAPLQMPTPASR